MDFHVHISNDQTDVQTSIAYFNALSERNGLDAICIQASVRSSNGFHLDTNEKALEICAANENWYAFASLHHDKDFVSQAKEYMERGFKGIKMLEGKPTIHRAYGYGFDHPRFEAFFDYCEKEQIPLDIHNSDPLVHWDITKISQSAIRKGWYYDSTFPSQEYFFETLEKVLEKHRNLRAALAHFGFYSDNIKPAHRLMEMCPNLYMDMTPAMIIYGQLSETPAEAREFLVKYQDRILYGTDVSNRIEGEVREMNDMKTKLLNAFYEGDGEPEIGGFTIRGIALDQSILEKLYYKNALAFMRI